jgi:hypothetical protein
MRSNVNLDLAGGPGSLQGLEAEDRARIIDQCKAEYIQQTIAAALHDWRLYHRHSGVAGLNDARRRSILSRLHVDAGASADCSTGDLLSPVKTEPSNSAVCGPSGSPARVKREGGDTFAGSPISGSGVKKRLALTKQEQEIFIKGRRPKAIVFSQHDWDLEVRNRSLGQCIRTL